MPDRARHEIYGFFINCMSKAVLQSNSLITLVFKTSPVQNFRHQIYHSNQAGQGTSEEITVLKSCKAKAKMKWLYVFPRKNLCMYNIVARVCKVHRSCEKGPICNQPFFQGWFEKPPFFRVDFFNKPAKIHSTPA